MQSLRKFHFILIQYDQNDQNEPPQVNLSARNIISIILFILSLISVLVEQKAKESKFKLVRILINHAVTPVILCILGCITTCISWSSIKYGLLGSILPDSSSSLVPIYILLLFFSSAYVCTSAQESKLFYKIAMKCHDVSLKNIKTAPYVGLILFVLFSAVTTLITSNDVVVLTLTPISLVFIDQLCKSIQLSKDSLINVFLLAEFTSANTFSISMLTANPTNVILGEVLGIDFIEYLKVMLLDGMMVGLVFTIYSFIVLSISIKKQQENLIIQTQEKQTQKQETIANEINEDNLIGDTSKQQQQEVKIVKSNIICSTCVLILMALMFLFSSIIGNAFSWFELYQPALLCAIIMLIKDIYLHIKKQLDIKQIIKNLPWNVPLFLLSMFIFVQSLIDMKLIDYISYYLSKSLYRTNSYVIALVFSSITVLFCILFNNLPGTIIVSNIVNNYYMQFEKQQTNKYISAFSVSAASNYGALFMPHCSLAGLLWQNLVDNKKVTGKIWMQMEIITIFVIFISSADILLMCSVIY